MRTAVVLALVASVALAAPQPGAFTLNMRRIETRRERMTREGTIGQFTQLCNASNNRFTKYAASPGYDPQCDYNDLSYVSDVELGTPAQTFLAILDTGSSNLWVPDQTCNDLGCSGKHKFNSSASSTYHRNGEHFAIQYGTGSASGFLGEDKFCFAKTNICFDKQVFGQATQLASFFANQEIDSICGMAFKSLAVDQVTPPFINVAGSLPKPLFTVWFTADGGNAGGQAGGQFTFGALDTTHCDSNVHTVSLSSDTYYQFKVDKFTVDGEVMDSDTQVISDTGTSLIGAPTNVLRKVAEKVGGTYDRSQGLYYVDCSKEGDLPDLVFTIDGNDYSVRAKNYVLKLDGKCYIGIEGFGGGFGGPSYILGDCWIREYCNVYNPIDGTIGFAKALK